MNEAMTPEQWEELSDRLWEEFSRFDTKVMFIERVEYIKTQLETLREHYNEEELDSLLEALAAIEAALANRESEAEEWEELSDRLWEEFDYLRSKMYLEQSIRQTEMHLDTLRGYYDESELQSLLTMLSEARAALTDPESGTEKWQELADQLWKELDYLNAKMVLEKNIEYVKGQLEALREHYNDDELQPLVEILTKAETTLANGEATNSELYTLSDQLLEAFNHLHEKLGQVVLPAAPQVTVDDEQNVIIGGR